MSPLISFVIPTRERAYTLSYAIKSILQSDFRDFQLLVCDNFSGDETRKVVESFSDQRLTYVRTPSRLSMTNNWEYAYNYVTGQYVCYIGDDDAIIASSITPLADILYSNFFDTISWRPPVYQWGIDNHLPRIIHGSTKDYSAKPRFPRKTALNVLRLGGWKYYNLAGTYHSLINRDILDLIKSENGQVFDSTQPDLYTSIAVSLRCCGHSIGLNFPVTCHGRSQKSNSGSSLATDGKKNVHKFKSEFGVYYPDDLLPVELSQDSAWLADAFIKAVKGSRQYASLDLFNFSAMWAFATRLGYVTPLLVLSNTYLIKSYHSFNPFSYIFFFFFHLFAVYRRQLIQFIKKDPGSFNSVHANILDYVNSIQ